MKSTYLLGLMVLLVVTGHAGTLVWNGPVDGAWDATSEFWLNGNAASAWITDSEAVFPSASTVVPTGDISASVLTFPCSASPRALVGGRVNLVSPATITGAGYTLNSDLAGTDGVAFVVHGVDVYSAFLPANRVKIWSKIDLASLTKLSATFGGNSINGQRTLPGTPCFFVNNGATATVQFQTAEGGYLKGIKLELSQEGSDVYAEVKYVKYYNYGVGAVPGAVDFDSVGASFQLATANNAVGYGLFDLAGECEGVRSVVEGKLPGTGTISMNGGALEIFTGEPRTMSNALSGDARVTFKGNSSDVRVFPGFVTTVPTVLAANAQVKDVHVIDARAAGASVTWSGCSATSFHETYVDGVKQCQMQFQEYVGKQYYNKVVVLELAQVGDDVTIKAIRACYKTGGTYGDDASSGYAAANIATGNKVNGYGIYELRYTLGGNCVLSGANTLSKAITVDASRLDVVSQNALPSNYDVLVTNGATLAFGHVLTGNMDAQAVGGFGTTQRIHLCPGTTFESYGRFNVGPHLALEADAATIDMRRKGVDKYLESEVYISNLTLMNGSRVVGSPFRVGHTGLSASYKIKSEGESENVIAGGIVLVKVGANSMYEMNVVGDLLVSGAIYDLDAGYDGMPVKKLGDGILTLGAVNRYTGNTEVLGGTLRLGADNALNSKNAVTLSGGALEFANVDNSLSTLMLTAGTTSTIKPGTGTLQFADCSQMTWGEDAELVIDCEVAMLMGTGRHLRFGTTAEGLSREQLDAISCGGHKVRLDSDGWLRVSNLSTCIIIR